MAIDSSVHKDLIYGTVFRSGRATITAKHEAQTNYFTLIRFQSGINKKNLQ